MDLFFKGSRFLEITFYFKLLKKYFQMKDIPLWLKFLNGINLLPILVWPIIALFSVFLMDNPNMLIGLGSIVLVNSYPFVLIGTLVLSFILYKKDKIILSILVSVTVTCLLLYFLESLFHIF